MKFGISVKHTDTKEVHDDTVNDTIAVNIIILLLGIPTIWVIGLVFNVDFSWQEIGRATVMALVFINVWQFFGYLGKKK